VVITESASNSWKTTTTAPAFCSVTFDDAFVVRDLKIIEGTKGSFVAMPSRKLSDRCNQCGCKNHLRARFCISAAADWMKIGPSAPPTAGPSCTPTLPIPSTRCREVIQGAVIRAFQEEKERSKQPGYVLPLRRLRRRRL